MTKIIIELSEEEIKGLIKDKPSRTPVFCPSCKAPHTVELWKKRED